MNEKQQSVRGVLIALAIGQKKPETKGPSMELVFRGEGVGIVRRFWTLTKDTWPHAQKMLVALGWDGVTRLSELPGKVNLLSKPVELVIGERQNRNPATGKTTTSKEVAFVNPLVRTHGDAEKAAADVDAFAASLPVPDGYDNGTGEEIGYQPTDDEEPLDARAAS